MRLSGSLTTRSSYNETSHLASSRPSCRVGPRPAAATRWIPRLDGSHGSTDRLDRYWWRSDARAGYVLRPEEDSMKRRDVLKLGRPPHDVPTLPSAVHSRPTSYSRPVRARAACGRARRAEGGPGYGRFRSRGGL